jgi:hypothetical protein
MTAKTLESPAALKSLLEETRTIAVVGLSDKPERDSHSIAAYMQESGYELVGVHPTAQRILGSPVYPSLGAIPEAERARIGLVVIFRKAEDVPQVLDEAALAGLRRIWLPPGAASPAAAARAEALGMTLVADKCLRTVHAMTHAGAPGRGR